ncbi:MAG: hydroxymethylglutaryl-CoA lyase [Phycisphaerales bacterium]|nr:hydroxymethylglutaryl-CoA lyase [Phycisphaerales bacterium]
MSERIWITEVGPRDGLQNEHRIVSLADKVRLIDRLADAGCPEVEVSSFVRADRVPQLADAQEVFAAIVRRPGTVYSALVPNIHGLERAIAAGADKVSLFTAASEAFNQKNTNASIAESIERFRPVVSEAIEANLPVRVYVSCAVACPLEGCVTPAQVASLVDRLLELGSIEIDLGDTIGAATPDDTERLLETIALRIPIDQIVLHLHDTRGAAIACARRAVELGVRRFDSACGGLGGCPFAPGAPGNVATGALLGLCDELGFATGIDRESMAETASWIRSLLGN